MHSPTLNIYPGGNTTSCSEYIYVQQTLNTNCLHLSFTTGTGPTFDDFRGRIAMERMDAKYTKLSNICMPTVMNEYHNNGSTVDVPGDKMLI